MASKLIASAFLFAFEGLVLRALWHLSMRTTAMRSSRTAAMVLSLVDARRRLSRLTLPSPDARIAFAARFLLDIY